MAGIPLVEIYQKLAKGFGNVIKGESNSKQQTIDYLKGKGYSDEVVAGIAANIDVETGGTFRHTQKQKGGSGVGLFQFTYVPMKRAYENYLKSTEKIDSSESQILFVIETLNNDKFYDIGKGHRKELKRVFKKGDVEEIATEFSKRFLRPGIPHLEKRIASALRNFKQED